MYQFHSICNPSKISKAAFRLMVEPQSLTEILQDPDPISIELCIVLELLIAAVAAGIMLLAPLCMAIVMAPVPLVAVFDIVFMALSCRSDQCQSKSSVGSNNVLPKGVSGNVLFPLDRNHQISRYVFLYDGLFTELALNSHKWCVGAVALVFRGVL